MMSLKTLNFRPLSTETPESNIAEVPTQNPQYSVGSDPLLTKRIVSLKATNRKVSLKQILPVDVTNKDFTRLIMVGKSKFQSERKYADRLMHIQSLYEARAGKQAGFKFQLFKHSTELTDIYKEDDEPQNPKI